MFACGTLLLFAFIYWRTAGYEARQVEQFLVHESAAIAREPPQDIDADIRARFAGDLHRLTFAAVLTPDRRVISGDLAAYPDGLPVDGRAHSVEAARGTGAGRVTERVTAVARALPDGRILVVGRSLRDLARLTLLVRGALVWSLVPAVLLALGLGMWASMRAVARATAFRETLDRILEGGLQERLPTAGTRDTFDVLAASVNRMLDQLERLFAEIRGVGDNIAHDLRTPLSRMRARLEGGRRRATSLAELDAVAVQAIADLDQCFAIITALLRIGELGSARRQSGFSLVNLTAIVEEVGDLYQPMAELRNQGFCVSAAPEVTVHGDRDLLFEMCANLLDNAIKFAPESGEVRLELVMDFGRPVLLVSDSGRGIPPEEREAVLHRFYRADRSRHVEGSGLGLSLVVAILKLHGLELGMREGPPGFVVEVPFERRKQASVF